MMSIVTCVIFPFVQNRVFEIPVVYWNRGKGMSGYELRWWQLWWNILFSLLRLTLRLCILHEVRQVLNIILTTVFSQTYIDLNAGNQKSSYHPRVRKYLMVLVKIIVRNNFQKNNSTSFCLTFLFSIAQVSIQLPHKNWLLGTKAEQGKKV